MPPPPCTLVPCVTGTTSICGIMSTMSLVHLFYWCYNHVGCYCHMGIDYYDKHFVYHH